MELNTELIITHGNGPVVGKILMRQAIARRARRADVARYLRRAQPGRHRLSADAGFGERAARRRQSAPRRLPADAGRGRSGRSGVQKSLQADRPFYTEEEAKALTAELGWEMREDSGRGWRHVVPSPQPKHIADISLIQVAGEKRRRGDRRRRRRRAGDARPEDASGMALKRSSTRTAPRR